MTKLVCRLLASSNLSESLKVWCPGLQIWKFESSMHMSAKKKFKVKCPGLQKKVWKFNAQVFKKKLWKFESLMPRSATS